MTFDNTPNFAIHRQPMPQTVAQILAKLLMDDGMFFFRQTALSKVPVKDGIEFGPAQIAAGNHPGLLRKFPDFLTSGFRQIAFGQVSGVKINHFRSSSNILPESIPISGR